MARAKSMTAKQRKEIHVTDFVRLGGCAGFYWALLVASVEEAVTAADGEVAGGTTMGSMITARVEVAVSPAPSVAT
jgi:pheromone shutdown protein TraB